MRSLQFLIILACCVGLCIKPSYGDWISPVSSTSPSGNWTNQANAYDDNTSTYASDNFLNTGWAGFLEMSLPSTINCNQVKVLSDFGQSGVDTINIEVYAPASANWVSVYTGSVVDGAWTYVTFNARSINKVRYRFHYISSSLVFWLYEIAVWDAGLPPAAPSVQTMLTTSEDDGGGIMHGKILDDGNEPCQYRMSYGLTSAYGMATTWSGQLIDNDEFSAQLTGLTVGEYYHYRAEARNSAGTALGEDRYFWAKQPNMGWISPTGATDTSNIWINSEAAHDDDTITYARAFTAVGDTQTWSPFLYLTHSPIVSVNAVRFFARIDGPVDQCDVDVKSNGVWTDIYQGTAADKTYVIKSVPTAAVTDARIRFHKSGNYGMYYELYELDLFKIREAELAPVITVNAVMNIIWVEDLVAESGESTRNFIIRRNINELYLGKLKVAGIENQITYQEDYTGIIVTKNAYNLPMMIIPSSNNSFGALVNNRPTKNILLEFNLEWNTRPLIMLQPNGGTMRTITTYSGALKSGLPQEYLYHVSSFNYTPSLKRLTFNSERFCTYSIGTVATVNVTPNGGYVPLNTSVTYNVTVLGSIGDGVEGAPVTVSILTGTGTLSTTNLTTDASGNAAVRFTSPDIPTRTVLLFTCDTKSTRVTLNIGNIAFNFTKGMIGYPTVRAALLSASANDEIRVTPGIYDEDTEWTINKNLILTSTTGVSTDVRLSGGGTHRLFMLTLAGSSVTISALTIENGWISGNYGGAIYLNDALTLNLTNVIITGNMVTGNNTHGGAIYTTSFGITGNVNAWNCIFSNNAAGGAGGVGIYGKWSLTNCIVRGNRAGTYGGVGYLGDWRVTGCSFIKNHSDISGGVGVYGAWAVTGSSFIENDASQYAGVGYQIDWKANTCIVSGNSAGINGGMSVYGTWVATNCSFSGNHTPGNGAVLYQETWSATNCSFTDNRADTHAGVGVYSTMNAVNCRFLRNSAGGSGGVAYQGVWKVSDSTCSMNNADIGAVAFQSSWSATSSIFAANTAGTFAGIAYESTWNVVACRFSGNRATTNGGVNVYGLWSAKNCLFFENTAGNAAGVNYQGTWGAEHCTFFGNSAAATGSVTAFGNFRGTNCSFWKNYEGGVMWREFVSANVSLNNCAVSTTNYSRGCTLSVVALVSGDPRFESEVSTNTLFLEPNGTSLLVDAGTSNTTVTNDINGIARPVYSGFDIGARERRELYISNYGPAKYSTNNALNANISFRIRDSIHASANISGVSVVVDGTTYTTYTRATDNSGSATDMYVVFDVPDLLSNTTINITLNASCSARSAQDGYWFSTIAAIIPMITPVIPAAGATSVSILTDIVFRVTDNVSVVTSSLMVTINGVLAMNNGVGVAPIYSSYSYTATTNGQVVSFNPGVNLPPLSWITVNVRVRDNESNWAQRDYAFFTATANVHNISYTPSRHYTTIQSGLDDARNGDIVVCDAALYNEGASISWPNTNNLTLRGNDGTTSQNVIITGVNTRRVFYINTSVACTLSGLTITSGNCGTGASGGGMYFNGSTLNMSDVLLQGNVAGNSGGGIYMNQGRLILQNSSVRNNRAQTQNGGGIYFNTGVSQAVLVNDMFTANGAGADAGAIQFHDNMRTSSVTACTFNYNVATANGGAISMGDFIPYTNCAFIENRAISNGGALYNIEVSLNNCLASGNYSAYRGGFYGVSVTSYLATLNIKDCTFINNRTPTSSNTYYGGVFNIDSNPRMYIVTGEGCVFSNNTSYHGGVIRGGYIVLNGATLNNNIAVMGGCFSQAQVTLNNCVISGNYSFDSGGVWYGSGINTPNFVINSLFINNRTPASVAADSGGCFYFGDTTTRVYIDRSIFRNNYAYNGGVIYRGNLVLTRSWFENNRSAYRGGVFYQPIVSANNCLFVSNNAVNRGGVVYSSNTSEWFNCTFVSNNARSGDDIYRASGTPRATNCIFWYCNDPISNTAANITYCDLPVSYTGVGNFIADPLFIDPVNKDFRIRGDSPCIDTGTNLAAPRVDYDGYARPLGPTVDIGAYEFPDVFLSNHWPARFSVNNETDSDISFRVRDPRHPSSSISLSMTVNGTAYTTFTVFNDRSTTTADMFVTFNMPLFTPNTTVNVTINVACPSVSYQIRYWFTIKGDALVLVTKNARIQAPANYIAQGGSVSDPVPGALMMIYNTFRNVGTTTANTIIITDIIPPNTEYLQSSVTSSVPATINFQHTVGGPYDTSSANPVVGFQWLLRNGLGPNQGGTVSFNVTIP